jgi:hypothetical protein
MPTGTAGGPDIRRPQRALRIQPGQGLHQRWPGAAQEGPAGRLRLQQPEDDHLQVGVLHGVDDHEPAAGHAGEDLGHPPRPAKADVLKGDAQDVTRPDRPAALLGDELAQVGGGVAEGGVAGELGLADRQDVGVHPGPVDVAGGEPAGLEVRRRQQHAVEASAGHLPARGVQPAHLGDDVPAQGRVAAADNAHRRVQAGGQLEQHPPDPGVQLHRVGLGQAAGVGQDEAGRAGLGQTGRELVRLEHGNHVDVVHRLGPRGVVVQDRNPPARLGQGLADPPPGVRLYPRRRQVRRQVRPRHRRRQETWRPPLMS